MDISAFKEKLYVIVFEAETPSGRLFDIGLLVIILLSVFAVLMESVNAINEAHGELLRSIEWAITITFSFEYLVRVWIVKHPGKYIFSFYGIIDLLSVLPTYLAFVITGTQHLMIIRALRLLRVFRILKLSRYVSESTVIVSALKASKAKISVFLYAVVMLVIIIGTLMYLVEGPKSGFTSIPQSIYWAIVTLTTVGYGDIAPVTTLGKLIAGFVMILGYSIIAVPTGIVSAEISSEMKKNVSAVVCQECLAEGHDSDAIYCKHCGEKLKS